MNEVKNNETGEAKTEPEQLFTKAQLDELLAKEKEGYEAKIKEAEKLAQMDAQQKASYQRKQAEDLLAKREAAVAKRELSATAYEKLAEYKLPKSLISCVNFASPEDCENSIQGIKDAFTQAVSDAVNERIRGAVPKYAQNSSKDAFLDGLMD